MSYVKAFLRFWYDFIIGDDWKIAAAVVVVLLVGAAAVLAGAGGLLPPLLAVGFGLAFAVALLVDSPRRRR